MSQQIDALSRSLSAAAGKADPTDLMSLADVHGILQRFEKELGTASLGADTSARLGATVVGTTKLVEQMILREIADSQNALTSMTAAVVEIQQLVSAALGGSSASATAPSASAASPAPVKPAAMIVPDTTVLAKEELIGVTELREEDLPLINEFISEARGHIEAAEVELLKLDTTPDDLDAVNGVFRAFHTIKGVAGFLNLVEIGAFAHAAESVLDLVRKGQLQITEKCLDLILESNDTMKRLIGTLEQCAKTLSSPQLDAAVVVLIQKLKALASKTAEVQVVAPIAEIEEVRAFAPELDATKVAPAAAALSGSLPQRDGSEATVKVATTRLDNLINVVGELVIAHAMTSQDMARVTTSDQRFLRNMAHLGKITRELQDLSMSMRMVPIQGVFQKMNRLVRDVARKAGKDVELILVGSETELDRNVVEAISDPLVHMVRNAADHGVERPEDRVAVGKSAKGQITLKAFHQAGNIVIEITDDGRGLNKDRILRKAIDAGIVREGQELTEQELFRLIFHAGLSTADKITDISGRGVGMDVVRKNIEALRGRIDITSIQGKGSTFTIRLPLTLAVIDGLIVKVGENKFIVPITNIEQSLRPKAEQLSTVQGRTEMCMLRGQLLPLVRLHQLFDIEPTHANATDAIVVIVHDDERRYCLLVDELLGQQQVVIKSLGKVLGQVPGTSGGAIMGDGCVSLILDVPGIIELVTPTR